MKYRTIALLGILFGLASAPVLTAQVHVYEMVVLSKEKVRKDGKLYLSHRVQENQTLYSIAKAYGVTLDDLYAANPGLMENGAKRNSSILIPYTEPASAPSAAPAYLEHTVMWYEDINDIASMYNVSVKDIMEANNLRGRKVVTRQVIKIPVKGSVPSPQPAAPAQTVTPTVTQPAAARPEQKTVVKTEEKPVAPPVIPTLSDPVIADPELAAPAEFKPVTVDKVTVKKADILPPEIPTLGDPDITDPELAAPGEFKPVTVDKVSVKKADILPPEIPTLSDPVITDPELAIPWLFYPVRIDPLVVNPAERKAAGEMPAVETVPATGETPVIEVASVAGEAADPMAAVPAAEEPEPGIFDWFTGKGKVEMALLLPFNASGSPSEINMDFYSGVLLALHDLETEGIKATLNVYDLQEGVPSAFTLNKNDFILGPVSAKDLTAVLEQTGGRIPVISPLDQRAASLAETHSGFIQAPSGASNQYADLAAWIGEEAGTDDQIILVTEKVSGSTAPAVGIREALLTEGIPFEGVSWTLSEGRSLPEALTARLTKGGVNRIIVASEKEAFVGDMLRNLGLLRGRGYDIVMYAPSKVRNFETLDSSGYHQNELHISSSYFADYNADDVISFVRAYRALYRTEPSQFAFQGYDLTRYFAGLCAKFGNRWTKVLGRETGTGLHTDFRFEQAGDGSFRNTGIRRIVFRPDYSTELVRP